MSRAARAVQVPGGEPEAQNDEAGATDETAEQELARLRAENAALKAPKVANPGGVFEPVTPHGKAALEASAFAHLTVAEVMAKIDAGEAKEPTTSLLCKDGYYCRRS